MKSVNNALASFAPYGPTIVRVVLGILLVWHGVDKFSNGLGGVEEFFAGNGIPAPALTAPLAAILEVALGATLIAGLFTRVSAIVMTGFLAVAVIYIKLEKGVLGGAELDFAYMAGLAAVALMGPGKFSVDEVMGTEHSSDLATS